MILRIKKTPRCGGVQKTRMFCWLESCSWSFSYWTRDAIRLSQIRFMLRATLHDEPTFPLNRSFISHWWTQTWFPLCSKASAIRHYLILTLYLMSITLYSSLLYCDSRIVRAYSQSTISNFRLPLLYALARVSVQPPMPRWISYRIQTCWYARYVIRIDHSFALCYHQIGLFFCAKLFTSILVASRSHGSPRFESPLLVKKWAGWPTLLKCFPVHAREESSHYYYALLTEVYIVTRN